MAKIRENAKFNLAKINPIKVCNNFFVESPSVYFQRVQLLAEYSQKSKYTHISQTRWDILPLEKFTTVPFPVENYSPIFVPAEKWSNKQILTPKISCYFFHLHWFFWLKTMEFKSPAIKNMGISIHIEFQSFVFTTTGLKDPTRSVRKWCLNKKR